jgi:hypothetical protein
MVYQPLMAAGPMRNDEKRDPIAREFFTIHTD